MWRHTHAINRTAAVTAAAAQPHHASVRGALAHLRTATLAVPSVAAAAPAARSLSSLACCVAISSSGSGSGVQLGPCVAPVRAFGSSAKSSGSGSSDMLPIITIEGETYARATSGMVGDA